MTKKSTKYNIKLKEDLICSNENDNWWKKPLIHMYWVLQYFYNILYKLILESHVILYVFWVV